MPDETIKTNTINPAEEKWLVEKIDYQFSQAEGNKTLDQAELDSLQVLTGALKVLGLEAAAQAFAPRLAELKKRASSDL